MQHVISGFTKRWRYAAVLMQVGLHVRYYHDLKKKCCVSGNPTDPIFTPQPIFFIWLGEKKISNSRIFCGFFFLIFLYGMICLFVCFVYSRLSNFSAFRRLSPLPVTGLQIWAYARRSGPLSRERSLSCHTYCDMGTWFIRSHPKDRHPRPTVGFEPPTQGSSDLWARRSNHSATRIL
jgi:hypothetical protein